MRFKRWPRIEAYVDTPRKRAAFHRSPREQRDKLPLLSNLIRGDQPDIETEMARRAAWWPAQQQETRGRRARDWRRARARLFGYGDNLRLTLRQLWRECPYPGCPACLLDLLHRVDTGRIDPERPPWKHPRALTPRVTPAPATFDEAFRQIGHRKVAGGPKTTQADEFTFIGNLGSGLLFLTTRVRLIDPRGSFYTPSNMRLRDSHVGRSGHFVDIQVCGICPDSDLALIERLARAADDRPVVVRRAG